MQKVPLIEPILVQLIMFNGHLKFDLATEQHCFSLSTVFKPRVLCGMGIHAIWAGY